MKRPLVVVKVLIVMFIAAQSQTQTQTNAKRDEPPIDCEAYSAQATSLYILPYRVGASYEVVATKEHYVRGNKGVGLNAIDFKMPIGTPVVAARAGIVVAVQESYPDDNGIDLQENYVFIKHSDGTIGRYFHLTQQGALFEVGDSVRQGEVIARSGNSGQSPFPHLHFDVQMCGLNLPPNYNQLPCGQTLPVTFRNEPAPLRIVHRAFVHGPPVRCPNLYQATRKVAFKRKTTLRNTSVWFLQATAQPLISTGGGISSLFIRED